ncbi:MAG: nickel-responsive transcriptional regulator NikR [Hyphomicrobium sp. 32-62-53]|nr:MAG: nickel-responsive transcriptional regulator NikR [Hyphomicrobium sp. 12-62-95]OYY01716.1 MAG: nickel-responsive transcriptional regulator NikR [Hyphomicrobium sp. 32-62-53]
MVAKTPRSKRSSAKVRQSAPATDPVKRGPVSRVTISLSEDLLTDLDHVVTERGFQSRSQAVADFVHRALVETKSDKGEDVMVGTITLFYDHTVGGLQQRLADLQRRYIDEVISSLHVHLTGEKTLEVILVQGPAPKLRAVAGEIGKLRGVISEHLQLAAAIIPQLHPLPAKRR